MAPRCRALNLKLYPASSDTILVEHKKGRTTREAKFVLPLARRVIPTVFEQAQAAAEVKRRGQARGSIARSCGSSRTTRRPRSVRQSSALAWPQCEAEAAIELQQGRSAVRGSLVQSRRHARRPEPAKGDLMPQLCTGCRSDQRCHFQLWPSASTTGSICGRPATGGAISRLTLSRSGFARSAH